MSDWKPIDTAPRDEDILVWYDHKADKYVINGELTDYACHAESGDFLDRSGVAIARWHEGWDEGGGFEEAVYTMPPCWLVQFNDDNSDYVCNPTHWQPLPEPPHD